MALPSLRNRPLGVKWAKIWSFADLAVQLISTMVLIIHFIFQQEAMMIFMAIISLWYFGLVCINHKHLHRLTQYRIYILAHSKNLITFINIIVFIYLSIRAYHGYTNINTSILYFMFAYIIICIYNIIAWVTSFMMLGSVEQTQPFKAIKGELYLDYYPIVYSKGRPYLTEAYSTSSDWVLTRGICQSDLAKAKQIPIVRKNSPFGGSSGSFNQEGRVFTTMNSDTKPFREGDDGISMGSKISHEMHKPGFGTKKSQKTNLTTETNGKIGNNG